MENGDKLPIWGTGEKFSYDLKKAYAVGIDPVDTAKESEDTPDVPTEPYIPDDNTWDKILTKAKEEVAKAKEKKDPLKFMAMPQETVSVGSKRRAPGPGVKPMGETSSRKGWIKLPNDIKAGTAIYSEEYGDAVFAKFLDSDHLTCSIRIRGIVKAVHNRESFRIPVPLSEVLKKELPHYSNINYLSKEKATFYTNNFYYRTCVGEIDYIVRDAIQNIEELVNTTEDIVIFLPVNACRVNNYSLETVLDYIDVLKGLELVEATVVGVVSLPIFELLKTESTSNPLVDNEFLKIYIKGEVPAFKFLFVKLLTAVSLTAVGDFAGIFMQMRKELCGENLSDWQMLLLTQFFISSRDRVILYDTGIYEGRYTSGHVIPNIYSPSNSLEQVKEKLMSESNLKENQPLLLGGSFVRGKEYKEIIQSINSSKQLREFINKYKTQIL